MSISAKNDNKSSRQNITSSDVTKLVKIRIRRMRIKKFVKCDSECK